MKPRKTLALASILILILGLAFSRKALDIQLHDTYLVFSLFYIAILICGFLLFSSFLYFMFIKVHRPLDQKWGFLQVWMTIISCAGILLISAFDPGGYEFLQNLLIIVFVLAQLLLLLMMALAIFQKAGK